MDKRDLLKSVLQNFINDKPDEAKADFHQYLTLKSKEITGIGATPSFAQDDQEHSETVTAAVAAAAVEEPAVTENETAQDAVKV